ncbi:hypothetical protein [Clostridium sp. BJN0013]|uniref:hypothetical protein n=1 Tax=Clostridium sp. BJN0013 TaxID=3236840 RepID=UPI0034C68A85
MDLSYTLGAILLSFVAEHESYAVMYRFSTVFIVLLLAIYSFKIFKNNATKEKTLKEIAPSYRYKP